MLGFLLVVCLAAPAQRPLGLAPGQQGIYRAHVEDFPKLAWVVQEELPVSDSPQLAGHLLNVLRRGSTVEIAAVAGAVAHPGRPVKIDQVLAVPVTAGEGRAGYIRARGVAVLETLLGKCGPGVTMFASVVGQELRPQAGGLVLDLVVWLWRQGAAPVELLSGLNLSPGPRLVAGQVGGAAVELAGQVVVVAPDGGEVWRSPAGEVWRVVGFKGSVCTVSGPPGARRIRVEAGSGEKKGGGLGARR